MSNNDWWKPSTPLPAHAHSQAGHHAASLQTPSRSSPLAQSSHTPNFYNSSYLTSSQYGTPARHRVGDELDEEDTRMAESSPNTFIPWMASSPVNHKTSGGQSPAAAGRSPAKGKSPETNANSPFRNRHYVPNAPSPDEDLPPTTSLRDSTSAPSSNHNASSAPPQSASASSSSTPLPPPSALQHTPTTTKLFVFGPPADTLARLRPWLEECGTVAQYEPGPAESNYWVVEYDAPIGASWALRRHGEMLGGRWLVGFKVVEGGLNVALGGPAREQGNGQSNGQGQGQVVRHESGNNGGGGGIGTPLQIRSQDVLRPQKPPVAAQPAQKKQEVYSWDQEEGSKGLTARAAEWFFGR